MKQANTAQAPLVSIGIPTYNRPSGLLRTLRCMEAQTYKNIEIIVSDNATPGPGVDSVLKMFAATDQRIRFYRQSSNIGALENFRFVLTKAQGAYFMWAADDDEWEPEFIERCLSVASLSGGSGMTGFSTIFRVSGTKQNNPLPALSHLNSKFKNSCEYLQLMQPSLFYGLHRREDVTFFLNERTFDFYDCYFILRIILNSGFSIIEDQLYLAGVDSGEYTIKHDNSQLSKPFLNYYDFYFYSVGLVISADGVSFCEKIKLILLIDKTVLALITHHEQSKQPRTFLLMNSIKVLWQKLGRYASKKPTFTSSKESGAIDSRLDEPCGVISYAQSGEDSIVEFAMKAMGVEFPTYLDIGAHHPWKLSNTYRFYQNGSKGVCVEPDPDLHSKFKLYRSNDVNLNVGVGFEKETALDFYVMSNPTLNTFSEEEARRYESMGSYHVEKVIQVPVLTIQQIIEENFFGICPDFISIDVEGLDFELVKSIDFSRFRPKVLCVETLTYSENRTERKLDSIIDYVKNNGYFVYGDTYINTIFVDQAAWVRQ